MTPWLVTPMPILLTIKTVIVAITREFVGHRLRLIDCKHQPYPTIEHLRYEDWSPPKQFPPKNKEGFFYS